MVLLLIVAFWLLSISLVLALCVAARDGDLPGRQAVRPVPAEPVGRARVVKIALVECEELETTVRHAAGQKTGLTLGAYFADSAA